VHDHFLLELGAALALTGAAMRLPSLRSIAMRIARNSGRGQGKQGIEAGAQPQQVKGGAGEAQLVLVR
jgi:hypothetical protein